MNNQIQPVLTENYNLQKKKMSTFAYFSLLLVLALAMLVKDNQSFQRANYSLNALFSLISFQNALLLVTLQALCFISKEFH